ncbi:MAG: site-specific DNA-methyltransferase [Candidatus Omnitrophica bacterium]|nr:site-specific DNA-methyltransferase [Candidatus Omnitrophota bacterium]
MNKILKKWFKKEANNLNDIEFKNWKEYVREKDIILDSLWVLPEREKTGVHTREYWGNFIPQIPHQAMVRFTKEKEWVLDTFVGSGTTLIKCKQLGRNGIGVELVPSIVTWASKLVDQQENPYNVFTKIITGDSRSEDTKKEVVKILKQHGKDKVQLLIMHPPYHNIIKFSNDPRDLSNASSIDEFLKMFREVVDNYADLLEKKRFLVLVIGDTYSKGEWIPLGFLTMQQILNTKQFILKSIVVKNIVGNRGKFNQEELWNYRALKGGFYIFRHEYVMFLQKL